MKTTALILVVMTLGMFSCKKNSSESSATNGSNLISNSSFETAIHQPDYTGWAGTAYYLDSLGNQKQPVVQDAPRGGGLYCVQLEPLWMPSEGYSETGVTGQTGIHIYQVTAWIKTIHWQGLVSLEQWRNGQLVAKKTISDTSGVWKQLSVTDTLSVLSTDLLKVHLSAGSTESASGKALFDLVTLGTVDQ